MRYNKIYESRNKRSLSEGLSSDYKINVKYASVDVYEDSYEQGELDYIQSYDASLKGMYRSLNDLLYELGTCGFSNKVQDYYLNIDTGELWTDSLQNDDGEEPSDIEMQLFKEGKINLYAAHLNVGISIVSEHNITETEAEELGLTIY